MAQEIQFQASASGIAYYALIRNEVGQVWDPTLGDFAEFDSGSVGNYAIGLAEQGSSRFYLADLPTLPPGHYTLYFFQPLTTPAVGDIYSGFQTLDWDGSAVCSIASVLAKLPDTLVEGRIKAVVESSTSIVLDAAADALLDRDDGIEAGYTLRQALRLMLSALAGKLSGSAGTSIIIRDVNNTKNRISAAVDAAGNRLALTLDAS